MKNSFFLVIPAQKKNPELLASYEKVAVNQWISELPTANPGLSTRLFYDYIEKLNKLEMPAQNRLEVLEDLRASFIIIEDYLRSRLILSGFPKGENEQKILNLIIAIEKHYTIGYWIVVKELTRRDVGWFQGKNTAIAIQRTIRGLSSVVVTHYMMFLPVPDWIWIDLHSLYRLSVKTKKEQTKVADQSSLLGKVSTPEDCYKQVLLLSLAGPSSMMQREVQQVYNFIGKICPHVRIESLPISHQNRQCIILMDEDASPYFETEASQADSLMMYMDFTKLYKTLVQSEKFSSQEQARFSFMDQIRTSSERLPVGLFQNLLKNWGGTIISGGQLFSDRLNRYIAIGLNATHSLQHSLEAELDRQQEFLAESYSDRALSCKFEREGVLSIGSLVSYRKTNESETKRALAIVIKITMPKQDGCIVFELAALAQQSFAITYLNIDAEPGSDHLNALLYGVKDKTGERSYIIMDSFMQKNDDVLRIFLNNEDFPIVLGDRKNIGLGYWQFECRRLEEKQTQKLIKKKQGYDFI